MTRGSLRTTEVAFEVDVDNVVPFLFLEVPQILQRGDARAADHPIQPPEGVHGGFDGAPAADHGGHVHDGDGRLSAGCNDLGDDGFGCVGFPRLVAVDGPAVVGDDDTGTGRAGCQGNGPADPSAPAGNDDRLPFEMVLHRGSFHSQVGAAMTSDRQRAK